MTNEWNGFLLATDKGKSEPLLRGRKGRITVLKIGEYQFDNYNEELEIRIDEMKDIESVLIFPLNSESENDEIEYSFNKPILTLTRSADGTKDLIIKTVVFGYSS